MFRPGTKVVFKRGTCAACEHIRDNYPAEWDDDAPLVNGRVYTVKCVNSFTIADKGELVVTGVFIHEYTHPKGWMHCSCQFREIDGDADAWHRIVEKSRPKTKELQPA